MAHTPAVRNITTYVEQHNTTLIPRSLNYTRWPDTKSHVIEIARFSYDNPLEKEYLLYLTRNKRVSYTICIGYITSLTFDVKVIK